VLVAEACNIRLEPLVEPVRAALTRARLSWVEQNYLRADILTAANTRFVDAQTDIELAPAWDGGEVASAEGLRFVVPVRTLNAGPNPRYFGPGRGVTYLNFLSDQLAGFHAVVAPGTLRDSLYILEGLLEQHTSLRPTELMTDNAGYTDQVFGLFRLLGYQFSPRLADLGDARFWRTNPDADYGPLNGIARHRVNTDLIASSWTTCSASPAACPPAPSAPARSSASCNAAVDPPRPVARSPNSAGSPRPSTCSPTSTTSPTGGASSPSSTAPKAATPSPARSSTVNAANSASATAKAKKTNLERSVSCSVPSCCGTPVTSTPPWPSSAATATPSRTPTSSGSHP